MQKQTRLDVLALCDAAKRMRDAANNLWWAHNPDDHGGDGEPPTLSDAQEAHSDAFQSLQRAEYYARRALDREAALMGANAKVTGA